MDKEIWKDIAINGNECLVSNMGRIAKLYKQFVTNNKKRPENSYLCVNISDNGKPKQLKVHRLIAKAFIPNPENKPCVNHIDGNKKNNNVNNLEWCTYSENTKHAFNMGLNYSGEKHHRAKLTDEERREIINNYIPHDREFGSRALARKYGVNHKSILYIVYKS